MFHPIKQKGLRSGDPGYLVQMELERRQLLKEIEMVEKEPPLEIVINSQESYTALKEKVKTENPETPPLIP